MTLTALPTDRDLRMLSLAGGGFLGLYTAVVLEELEALAQKTLREADAQRLAPFLSSSTPP
jgi:hypothetical protein